MKEDIFCGRSEKEQRWREETFIVGEQKKDEEGGVRSLVEARGMQDGNEEEG